MNNVFSKKNKLLYKMKFINTRNMEYKSLDNKENDRIEKFSDKKKWVNTILCICSFLVNTKNISHLNIFLL